MVFVKPIIPATEFISEKYVALVMAEAGITDPSELKWQHLEEFNVRSLGEFRTSSMSRAGWLSEIVSIPIRLSVPLLMKF